MGQIVWVVRLMLSLFVAVLLNGSVRAEEPILSLEVREGWVTCRLIQDNAPVSEASLTIRDSKADLFGEGVTDEAGQAMFPLPPGSSFLIQLQIGDREADPIFMTRISETEIVPGEVLVSFGLKPCCKPTAVRSNPGELPNFFRVLGAGVFLLLSILIVFRPRRPEPGRTSSKRKPS